MYKLSVLLALLTSLVSIKGLAEERPFSTHLFTTVYNKNYY